ncbi:MAG: hypothetical protein A2Y77_16670, partial [Planctomycetes bacterium RBG_13_62_9]
PLSRDDCGAVTAPAEGVSAPATIELDRSVCVGLENENTRDRDEVTGSPCRGLVSPLRICRLGELVLNCRDGAGLGGAEGDKAGGVLGLRDGLDGDSEGDRLGLNDGVLDGDRVGALLGLNDGVLDGDHAGDRLGLRDGLDGDSVGDRLGLGDGLGLLRDGAALRLGLDLMASRR